MKIRQKIRKGIISVMFFLFPAIFYYLSPVLIVQASAKGIVSGSFIIFVLLFIGSLLFGRAYCGWLCPAGGCQEILFGVRDKKVQKGNTLKWILWIPWVSSIVIIVVNAGGYYHVDFFYQTDRGLSVSDIQSLMTYLSILFLLIVLPSLIFGRRSFCHHLCWMAPFMILGRKLRNRFRWASLQIRSSPSACKHCHQCIEKCPMSLPVEELVNQNGLEKAECILCGSCVDTCKQNAITFTWI